MGGMEVEEKGSQREAILSTESIGIHRADVFWNEVEKLLLSEGGKWKSSELALDLVDCPKTTTSDNMYLKPQSSIALRRHGSEPVNSYDGSPFEFSLKELPSSPAFLPNEKLKTRRQSLGLELISNTEAPQVTRKRHSSQTGSRYDNSSVTVAGTAPHVQGFHSSLNSTVSLLSTGSESKGSTPWLQSFHNISDETKAALTNVLELLNVLVKRMRKSKWTLDLQEYSAEQSLTLGEFKPIKEYLDSILASLGSRAIRVVSNRLESPCWALVRIPNEFIISLIVIIRREPECHKCWDFLTKYLSHEKTV